VSSSLYKSLQPKPLANLIFSVSGPGETGLAFIAHTGYTANECSMHMGDGNAGTSIQEIRRVFNESARCDSDSAGQESGERMHGLCSSTTDLGKRLTSAVLLQPQSVSVQDMKRSKATRAASPDLVSCEEYQDGLNNSKINCSRTGQPAPQYWLGFTRDTVYLAIKQYQLVWLNTSTRMAKETAHIAQPVSCQYAAMGKECGNLQDFGRSSAAGCASMTLTHVAGSGNPSQRSSTTTHARSNTTGSALATRSAHFMHAHIAGLGSGDGGDDPDDHNKQCKPLRGHEIDTADREEELMLDVCPNLHQQSHLQRPEEPDSSMEDDQDAPRYGRGRSCSCSSNAAPSFTVGVAQRNESVPAQTEHPQRINTDGPNPESHSPPQGDDPGLRQALIRRSSMVRASDITGEPTVDAPWMHHMRPTSLLALRKGAEGYGGYGGLASLPDAETSSRSEDEHITPKTLQEARNYNTMDDQTATNRDSFSFVSSVSSTAQHVALSEESMEEPPDTGVPPPDQDSIISQHRALVEGPPEELLYTYALQNRGLLEALFEPTTTDIETSGYVEGSEPRRPSVPHMTRQAPSDSFSTDDLSTREKSQIGLSPHGIRERCKKRQREGSNWSTVFCCLGDTEHDRQSSPETERSSSETARSKNSRSQTSDQDRHQDSGLGQRPARTEVSQDTCDRVPDQTFAVMDTPASSEKFAESEPDGHAIMAPTTLAVRGLPRIAEDGDPTLRP